MKFMAFTLMPYRHLDLEASHQHRSAWVVLPNTHYDPEKGAAEYDSYIDMLAHAETLARVQGFRSIHLDCFSANPAALALYERLGYRRTGTATMRKGPFVCFEKLLAP